MANQGLLLQPWLVSHGRGSTSANRLADLKAAGDLACTLLASNRLNYFCPCMYFEFSFPVCASVFYFLLCETDQSTSVLHLGQQLG